MTSRAASPPEPVLEPVPAAPAAGAPGPLSPAHPGVVSAFGAALGEPGRLRTRAIDRLKMSHDASHYALVPQAVAEPVDAAEVGRLLDAAAAHGIPITFRSGGTSLSGQAGTDGILVDTRTALPQHRGARRRRCACGSAPVPRCGR